MSCVISLQNVVEKEAWATLATSRNASEATQDENSSTHIILQNQEEHPLTVLPQDVVITEDESNNSRLMEDRILQLEQQLKSVMEELAKQHPPRFTRTNSSSSFRRRRSTNNLFKQLTTSMACTDEDDDDDDDEGRDPFHLSPRKVIVKPKAHPHRRSFTTGDCNQQQQTFLFAASSASTENSSTEGETANKSATITSSSPDHPTVLVTTPTPKRKNVKKKNPTSTLPMDEMTMPLLGHDPSTNEDDPISPPPPVEYRCFSDAQVEELRKRSNSIANSSDYSDSSSTRKQSRRPIIVVPSDEKQTASIWDSITNNTNNLHLSPLVDTTTTAREGQQQQLAWELQQQQLLRQRRNKKLLEQTATNTIGFTSNNNNNNKTEVLTAHQYSPQLPKATGTSNSKPVGIDTTTPSPQQQTCNATPASSLTPTTTTTAPTLNTVLAYVKLELLGEKEEGSPEKDCDKYMEEFLRVPSRLERVQGLGMLICTDCFLNILILLPLKLAWSLICLVAHYYFTFQQQKRNQRAISPKYLVFSRRHLYTILQSFIVFSTYAVLSQISVGMVYHWIRGQTMMKLYLLVAIVEVFDRLMCGFGQDALDSLFWNTTRRPHAHPRLIVSLVVVFVYALLHSLVLFLHITTVNVAMNSADHALLSLLIGGNFAEIKGTVFKKHSKKNLFQITMSDICERFKLLLFLFLIMMLNLFQGRDNEHLYKWLEMGALVLASEMLCDWIKHSFITRLNFIRSDVYEDYSLILAGDVTGIGHEGVNLDNTHAVVKRLGLAQIPILCVTMRYLREALRYFYLNHNNIRQNGHWKNMTQVYLLIFAALLFIKVLLGMILAVFASRTVCVIGNRQQVNNSDTGIPNNMGGLSLTAKAEPAEKHKRKVV